MSETPIGPDDPVRSVTAFEPTTAPPNASLIEMAVLMRDAGCGALIVTKPGAEPAIATERDLITALAAGGDGPDSWATDVMTRELLQLTPDDTIRDAAELMLEANVRHVVIADDEQDRLGVVSIRDVLGPLLA